MITGTLSEDYNLFAGTTAVSGTVTQGSHSFVGDPGFVDAAGGNYHLTASSEALNVGTDLGLATDWDGDARPGGSGFDLGCDETSFGSDVALAKTAVATPGPNQPISYTLTFSNVGSAMLPRLTITDALPIQVVAPITISSTVAISQTSTDPYVWQVHNLAPGASGIITVSGVLADVLPHGLITNTATIGTIANEVDLTNNSAQASIDVPNIGPIAVDDIKTIGEDETVVLNPTLNDIDGDVLTIESITTPGYGTAVLSWHAANCVYPHPGIQRPRQLQLHRHRRPEQRQRPPSPSPSRPKTTRRSSPKARLSARRTAKTAAPRRSA